MWGIHTALGESYKSKLFLGVKAGCTNNVYNILSYLEPLNGDGDGQEDTTGQADVRAALSKGKDGLSEDVEISKSNRSDKEVGNNKDKVREAQKEQEKAAIVAARPEIHNTKDLLIYFHDVGKLPPVRIC